MQKFFSLLVLMFLPLLAVAQEREAASAPSETVSMVYVVIFGVIFLGMIVGFFIYLWWSDREKKPE